MIKRRLTSGKGLNNKLELVIPQHQGTNGLLAILWLNLGIAGAKEQAVANELTSKAIKQGSSWIYVGAGHTIAEKLGTSYKPVQTVLQKLSESGLLIKQTGSYIIADELIRATKAIRTNDSLNLTVIATIEEEQTTLDI